MNQIQNPSKRIEPINWSKYERTYNNAIDLCAQCIGYHRARMLPLKAITLKPMYYELFKKGLEVLMKKRLEDPFTDLYFDGVLIKKGETRQFENMVCEYYPKAIAQA